MKHYHSAVYTHLKDMLSPRVTDLKVEGEITPGRPPFSRLTMLPVTPTVATLGATGVDRHRMIVQLDLFYPLSSIPNRSEAEELAALFGRGYSAQLTYGSTPFHLRVYNTHIEAGDIMNNTFRYSLLIYAEYYA